MSNVGEISTNRREAIMSGASEEEQLVEGNLTNLEICTQRPIQMRKDKVRLDQEAFSH